MIVFFSSFRVGWAEITNWAPLFVKRSDLTFQREEIVAPFCEKWEADSSPKMKALRPLYVSFSDQQRCDRYFLYPLFSYHKDPQFIRWNLFSLLRVSYAREKSPTTRGTFQLFPLIFKRESGEPTTSYEGIFPFAGKMHNFFTWDKIEWSLFPLYLNLERDQIRREYLLFPFFSRLRGPGASGTAVWPLYANMERKGVYKNQYFLWPLLYRKTDQLEKATPRVRKGFLPFYALEQSATVKDETFLYPFFGYRKESQPKYHEVRYFWPLFVQARGEDHFVNRWAPFYTHSIKKGKEKKWIMWPLVKRESWEEQEFLMEQERFLYFLIRYRQQQSKRDPTLPPAKKMHVWPLYSYWDNGAGYKQFQLLSPFEPIFPSNRIVRHLYTPLFALYRYEQKQPGYRYEGLFFDWITREKTPDSEHLQIGPLFDYKIAPTQIRFEFVKGLLGFYKKEGKRKFKIFWITLG